ncbi:hypothetical protein FRAHR75_950003 [Frankia sp. Hr75.2]|nr:hypothetical protein FRAHR75_950003 [Frankia sp. Hr75.2]
MKFQQMTPGRDPPVAAVRTELLYDSEHTRVSRLVFPTESVIREELLGPDAQRRLRHEVEILERLSGVEGVLQLAADMSPCPGSIMLADVGGTVLSQRATPLTAGHPTEFGRTGQSGRITRARRGGDASPGCGAPGHQPGEHRSKRSGLALSDQFHACHHVYDGPAGVPAPERDCRDGAVSGAGADRSDRPPGGPAG